MDTAVPVEGVPSPTKKAYKPAADAPAVPEGPSDLRGSLRPRTNWDELLRVKPAQSRMAVARGHTTTASSSHRRPLGPAATEPILSFAQPSVPSYAGYFKSSKDALDEAYAAVHGAPVPSATGKRADELRPMWETGSASDAASTRAASLRAGDSGFWGAAGAAAGPVHVQAHAQADDDGDGFDLDEALGPATGGLMSFAGFSSGVAQAPTVNVDSQGSGSTAHAVTQRFKRAFDGDAPPSAAAQGEVDDEEMAATDVEDEGGDEPAPMGGFGQARRVAGLRKGWGKTQSLPPSAFASMDF
ncbi:hypothetical protein JCM3775_000868 [Rhodotorula graminis]|uniref:Uncharacterized protein n=1 Tax=Rhodotorula graminis (strain WP1) TaxID=578459 RepID=A0A194S5F3_RHOGW|nr:uncharacterized protein RHOBADRAFT_52966 [Rhodotorula graminis WP1]KPV75958.1 hypothetical protein RHOBADRAFT_52966 [Rhodotorula graminis WP1]